METNQRDDIFVGRISGIASIISFLATSLAKLKQEFQRAVDDYVQESAANGSLR